MLAFVFMQSFDLHIEDGIRVEFDALRLPHVVGQTLFIG